MHNDTILGLTHGGAMTEARLLALLADAAKRGRACEIYLHPAIGRAPALERTMADYDHAGEFSALMSPALARAVVQNGYRLCTFRALG